MASEPREAEGESSLGGFEVMAHHKQVRAQEDSPEVRLQGPEAGGGKVSGEA